MPGFFRKTLTFLGFIDEDIEENVPQKYNEDKRISKYSILKPVKYCVLMQVWKNSIQ